MSKEIEDEIYLMVFGLLNGGSKIPSKDEIKKFIVMQLDIKKMASETTGEVFSIDEINQSIGAGFTSVSLGKSRFRTETAAVIACHSVSFINE